VVVVTGLGTAASQWSQVRAGFQQVTRTCFYDRPGLGASPPRPVAGQVVDAGLYARELKSLLYAAGEPGPYIVVGHSFGGLIARAFVVQNMSSVLGVMLAESVDPGDTTTGAFWHEAGHAVDMARSQAADGGGPWLGGRPLLVLSASHPEEDHLGGPTYGQPQWLTDQWIAEQRADVRLSSDAIQVIATSGHVLQQDDPPAVVEAVRELVRSVVTGARLACSPVWASVASTCR
jgi:pimeloyl-ACP methyl ester carboxylesterase